MYMYLKCLTREEFREAIDGYKAKVEAYQAQFEAAEIAAVKASRAEAFGSLFNQASITNYIVRRTLSDLEKAHQDALKQRTAVEERLQASEARVQELEEKLEEDGKDSSDMAVMQQRLAEALEDEREQHRKDLEERDFNMDQTQKKYQGK